MVVIIMPTSSEQGVFIQLMTSKTYVLLLIQIMPLRSFDTGQWYNFDDQSVTKVFAAIICNKLLFSFFLFFIYKLKNSKLEIYKR